jgi:nucleoside-diphosphate-sugar epimerase
VRVLVTGHCGNIGVAMVLSLLQDGHDGDGLNTNFYERIASSSRPDTPQRVAAE